jgi:putative peptide zinc metalloprotease protein
VCRQDPTSTALGNSRLTVDTSERQESYLLEADNGSVIRLSATAHHVLTSIDEGASAHQVAHQLSERLGRRVIAADVEAAYAQVRQKVDAISQRTRRPKPFGLWFRVRLLPISAVGWLSRRLSCAFHPLVALAMMLLIVGAAVATLAAGRPSHEFMMGGSFLPLMGLYMISMLAHELGHASASTRYGVPARDIGFGLYLVYPVFYNDVTAAWRLTRRQRVVIDLSGVFFQFAVGATYVLIHRLTGLEVFRLAATSVFLLGFLVLLPIFKFDGYWLMTDVLGVPNLSRQVRRVAAHVRDRLLRRTATRLPWSPWVSTAVLVYGAFSVLFLTSFVLRLALVVPAIAAEYPARVGGLLRDLSRPPHTPAPGRVSSVLGPTYIMLGVSLAFFTLSRRMIYAVRPALVSRRTRGAVGS